MKSVWSIDQTIGPVMALCFVLEKKFCTNVLNIKLGNDGIVLLGHSESMQLAPYQVSTGGALEVRKCNPNATVIWKIPAM